MIVNVEGFYDRAFGKLSYQIPEITLDRKYNFKIGVKLVHLEFLENFQIEDNELISIGTNLIDLSSINSSQSIYFFWNKSKNKLKQSSFVEDVNFYPLQVYETENCFLSFTKFFSGEPLKIKNFLVQFQIKRSDILNGRFQ